MEKAKMCSLELGPQSRQPAATMKAAGALWRNFWALQKPVWNGEHFIFFSSLRRPSENRITEIDENTTFPGEMLTRFPDCGGEDKDTQREKVKDRRRRLERPGSFQLNKVSRKAD